MTALWPNENPTRLHDGSLRVQPVWMVKHGEHIKYCVSRDEMLTFAQARWHSLYCYVLRAPQNITPANLTGDTLMDRPEWGIPIYRNSTWDVLGTKPMDGITTPVFRSLPTTNGQLQKAGVQAIYLPRPNIAGGSSGTRVAQGDPEMFIGYGWIHDARTRHTLREEIVEGVDVNHTFRFGMSSGGTVVEWVVDDTAIGANRNIINNANGGFGREIQVAMHAFDQNEPPGPNDTGQQNPTQGGVAYGNPYNQNALSPPEVHPLGSGFDLEDLLACGSPVVSFTVTDEPLGGKSFDVVTCPLDFQSDRYGAEINRETTKSRIGEYFLTNPIAWPTTLFRTKFWANYKGDDRVVRYDSWLDTAIDWTNSLNANFPQLQTSFVSLNQDSTGWFNVAHFYDPATDALTDITTDADLWNSAASIRVFVVGREGVYRLNPSPTTRWGDCPFLTRHAAMIFESQDDNLCFGFYHNIANNQDPLRSQEFECISNPSPVPFPSPTASTYGLSFSADNRHRNRETNVGGKPDTTPPGVYGPYTSFFVVGDLATVRAKIRALYLANELP